jgi:hypothetical protein
MRRARPAPRKKVMMGSNGLFIMVFIMDRVATDIVQVLAMVSRLSTVAP